MQPTTRGFEVPLIILGMETDNNRSVARANSLLDAKVQEHRCAHNMRHFPRDSFIWSWISIGAAMRSGCLTRVRVVLPTPPNTRREDFELVDRFW